MTPDLVTALVTDLVTPDLVTDLVTPDLVTPDLVTPDLVTPDLVTPRRASNGDGRTSCPTTPRILPGVPPNSIGSPTRSPAAAAS